MKNFLKNTKGAVTVFVTLLLVPAILVSGTAVDLTRIYTARSIVSDANQMAANAVLSQYDALLHDLYGIFGVAKDDPVLAQLLDEYISVTVFGEEGKDTSMGTLQLFYGSGLSLDELYFEEDKNLRNPDVLMRQIEEYMKFRAPVIVVKELLELLGSNTFKEDAGVVEKKLEIDEDIARMLEKYSELYEAIAAADLCVTTPYGVTQPVGVVSAYLGHILDEFVNLDNCYKNWEKEKEKIEEKRKKGESYSTDKRDDYASQYRAILYNIKARTIGGQVGKNWNNGSWGGYTNAQGLNVTIENAINSTKNFKPKFDDVVIIARQIDAMNAELTRKVSELQSQLDNGQCNKELKDALTQKDPATGKSTIETYRDILKWDNIEGMANIFKDGGVNYIDGPLEEMLNGVIYRNRNNPSNPSLNREQLANAPVLSSLAISAGNNIVSKLASYTSKDVSCAMPGGFLKFGEHPGENKAFFKELSDMVNQQNMSPAGLYEGQEEPGGGNAQKKQQKMIDELLELAESARTGLTNNQLGAKYINSGAGAGDEDTGTSKSGKLSATVSGASGHPVADVISDPQGTIARAGDYILLLTYCTSMFSNYTTARPEINGKSRDETGGIGFPKSISGIPLSPEVNYFFQSEWEYLYNGSSDADKNLNAVSRLIYLVRVICNYITVFSVSEVTAVVNSIRSGFLMSPLGIALGELARAAFVAAESAVDLAALRAGYKLPLIKSAKNGEWTCSPSGVVKALSDVTAEAVRGDDGSKDDNNTASKEKGLSYSNYMLFFFLTKGILGAKAVNELAERTADLIEWNVLNYKHSVNCDEGKMAQMLSVSGRFKMEDMKTDFSLTVTVDMRMLFLTMIPFRNFAGSRGVLLPQTMPVTVTEHRGY